MSEYSDALRAHVAWLLHCFNEGYVKAEDRAGMKNWLLDDESTLHPNDAALRPHLLALADELLDAIQSELKTGEAIADPRMPLWGDVVWPPSTVLPSEGIEAPWSPDRVANLNEFQREGRLHPYTCHNRSRATHPQREGERDFGLLVATPDGWICRDCDYVQDWF